MKNYAVKKPICFVLFFAFLCSGCCPVSPKTEGKPYRIVTRIDIAYENDDLVTKRQIFREEKMRPILDYLRYLDPYGVPLEDPDLIEGNDCFITLCYSDGSQCVYQQRADLYFRKDRSPWKRVDPAKAMELKMLLWMIPGDDTPVADTPAPPLLRPEI
jgi:hypothetical protein